MNSKVLNFDEWVSKGDKTSINEAQGYRIKQSERKFISSFVSGDLSVGDSSPKEILEIDNTNYGNRSNRECIKMTTIGRAVIGEIDWKTGKAYLGNAYGNISQTYINAFKKDVKNSNNLELAGYIAENKSTPDIVKGDISVYIPHTINEMVSMYDPINMDQYVKEGMIVFTLKTPKGCFCVLFDGNDEVGYYDEVATAVDDPLTSNDWEGLLDDINYDDILKNQMSFYEQSNDAEYKSITIKYAEDTYNASILQEGDHYLVKLSHPLETGDIIAADYGDNIQNLIVSDVLDNGDYLMNKIDYANEDVNLVKPGDYIKGYYDNQSLDLKIHGTKYYKSKNVLSVVLNESFMTNDTLEVAIGEMIIPSKILEIFEDGDDQIAYIHLQGLDTA